VDCIRSYASAHVRLFSQFFLCKYSSLSLHLFSGNKFEYEEETNSEMFFVPYSKSLPSLYHLSTVYSAFLFSKSFFNFELFSFSLSLSMGINIRVLSLLNVEPRVYTGINIIFTLLFCSKKTPHALNFRPLDLSASSSSFRYFRVFDRRHICR
jgi:hypothetical protein